MKSVELHNLLDAHGLATESIKVGSASISNSTPDLVATLSEDGKPLFRIDIYCCPDDVHVFQDAIIWGDFVAIGFGERVHLVNTISRQTSEISLGSYFGYIHKHGCGLLIASAERVFCVGSDGNLQWQSPQLGIDGVVLHELTEHEIYGAGEWDPPDGWQDFKLSTNGDVLL